MCTLVYKIKERSSGHEAASIPLVPSILRVMRNYAMRPLLAGYHGFLTFFWCTECVSFRWGFDGLSLAALATLFPFYIKLVESVSEPS